MDYAKLINGIPRFASRSILHNGIWCANPPAAIYVAEGYKPVRYAEQPEPPGVGWWIEKWEEADEAIVQGWDWHEATDEDEISPEEALDMLLGGEGG